MSFLRHIKRELRDLRNHYHHKMFVNPKTERDIINNFHRLYYESSTFGGAHADTFWMGLLIMKCPLDLFIYQELIYKLRPDVIIETGTARGGSALYLAQICDLVGKGEIITIDIEGDKNRPKHKRIKYILGSSTSPEIVKKVKDLIKDKKVVLVILDSDHSGEHVFNELNIYKDLVTKGSYIIVEDTNTNGNPMTNIVEKGGAIAGVRRFMKDNKEFVTDKSMEKFLLTMNPDGYLKKIR